MKHRNRLLEVLSILERETDRDHRLTLSQLIERLGMDPTKENVRRNVRGDLKALKEAGWPIECDRHKAPEYYIGRRRFTAKELKVLIDLVQSARVIPQEMSDRMEESILSLASDFEAESLASKVRVSNRVKLFNDELIDSIWEIKRAMDKRRKIRFRYFHYSFDFKRVYHSDGTVETPLGLLFSDGAHYVMTYNDIEQCKKTRRVDRMTDVIVLDEKATWKAEFQDFDIDESTLFGMFSGPEALVTLTAREDAMNALIDHFGRNMDITDIREVVEGDKVVRYAEVRVKVAESPQFEGWLTGLGDLISRKE